MHGVTTKIDIFYLSRLVLLRMRNVSDKSCRENQNTHFMLNNLFSEKKNARHLGDNVEKYGRAGQATSARCMNFVCWITKATVTRTEYVILTAFVCNDVQANTPQFNVVHTLSVFCTYTVQCFYTLKLKNRGTDFRNGCEWGVVLNFVDHSNFG